MDEIITMGNLPPTERVSYIHAVGDRSITLVLGNVYLNRLGVPFTPEFQAFYLTLFR